jgi:two-component system cell cycle sensor histidine kinase/response regulator CckA
MSGTGLPDARERSLDAEVARRRMVVRYVAAAFGVMTGLAVAQLIFVGGPLATRIVNVGAVFGYCGAFWFARRPRSISLQAGLLLANTQLLVTATALTVNDTVETGASLMFQGLTPLVAAATLRTRGTLLTTLAALASFALVFALELHAGVPLAVIVRALGGALFFVLVAGMVAVPAAAAAQRSLHEQIARDEVGTRAQAVASAAEERFRIMADQVSDLVSVHDAGGHFTFASASYRHILDLDPAALIGRTAPELLLPEDVPAAGVAFMAALGGQARELVCRIVARSGVERTFHVRMVRVDLEAQPHVAIAARDITQLQQLTTEVESARRMDALGRLASGVAHDFNNLLAVVSSCAGMIRAQLPNDNGGQRDLDVIDDAVEQAATLTGQLLSFARSQVLPSGRTAPGAAVARLAPLLQRALGEQVELELNASSSRWETQLAAGQLEQIVMNLGVNARDAMPNGGRLRLRVRDCRLAAGQVPPLPEGEYVLVEVSDTGTGMSPEVQAQVFEPFFSTKSVRGGSGLGLATSFGLARQIGGTLTVESALGVGSSFRLYLPRLREVEPQRVAEPVAQASPDPAALNVLVIDDDPRISELTARLLETHGYRAVTAESAELALQRVKEASFDAILTDVVLGREDGLDVLAQLRREQPEAGAIVMSGFAPSPERLDALRQAGVVFLAKPFASASLRAAIQSCRARRSSPPG